MLFNRIVVLGLKFALKPIPVKLVVYGFFRFYHILEHLKQLVDIATARIEFNESCANITVLVSES